MKIKGESGLRTCCFFGHRRIFGEAGWLRPLVEEAVERLIVCEKVERFLFGGYGRFDDLCHSVVRGLKARYPHISMVFVLAYYRAEDEGMKEILEDFDDNLYPPLENVPPRFAISRRNQEMVKMSDFCVFFVNHGWGGAASSLLYARRKKKNIINFGKLE